MYAQYVVKFVEFPGPVQDIFREILALEFFGRDAQDISGLLTFVGQFFEYARNEWHEEALVRWPFGHQSN
jgi:hypothetical protein